MGLTRDYKFGWNTAVEGFNDVLSRGESPRGYIARMDEMLRHVRERDSFLSDMHQGAEDALQGIRNGICPERLEY